MQCTLLLLCSLAVFCSIITTSYAQMGTDCSRTVSCMLDQTCFSGYCVCNRGFVKNVRQCFPVRRHGQQCFVAAQCVDHRMNCGRESSDDEYMKCICDQYHTWDAEADVCVQKMNSTEILASLEEKYDNEGRIAQEAKTVFLGAIIAGSLVICLGAIFIVGCLSYVCCQLGRKKIIVNAPEKFSLIDPESQKPRQSTPSAAKATEATGGNAAATSAMLSGSAADPLLQAAAQSEYVAAGAFTALD